MLSDVEQGNNLMLKCDWPQWQRSALVWQSH